MDWNVKMFRHLTGVDIFSDDFIKDCLDTVIRTGGTDRRIRVANKLLIDVLTAPGRVNPLWAKNLCEAGYKSSFFIDVVHALAFVMQTERVEFFTLDMNILVVWYYSKLSIDDLLAESRIYAGTTPSCYKSDTVRSDSKRQKAYEQFWEMLGVDYKLGSLTYPSVLFNTATQKYVQQNSKVAVYNTWSDVMKAIKRLYVKSEVRGEPGVYEVHSCTNQLYQVLQKI